MARQANSRNLGIWMNGIRVGRWRVTTQGAHELNYEASWLESAEARPISLSLPLAPSDITYSGKNVESFFDNLLPDSTETRQRIRRRYGAPSVSTFDLLAEVGRDCVGAIQLLRDDEEPIGVKRIDAQKVGASEIERILQGVTSATGIGSSSVDDSFRISIAGAQEKTALLRHGSRWSVPLGSTPTTHILKLPLGKIGGLGIDMSGSVENEWLCSRIARLFGMDTAHCEIGRFGDTTALVVERFDRRLAPDRSWIMRLPQEDFCQVTGTASSMKYESDGGPGMASILRVLLGSQDAVKDREAFMMAQVFFWLIAAPDGHAKNFSVFIEQGGRFRMTPLYDIISAYPVMGHVAGRLPPGKLRLAMAFQGKNRHYEWNKIGERHLRETAHRCGVGDSIGNLIDRFISAAPGVLSKASSALPAGFPDSVAGSILEGLEKRIKLLEGV